MPISSRVDQHLNLGYLPNQFITSPSASSPIERPGSASRSPFGNPPGLNAIPTPGSARLGAGSPSHELGGRLYSKRAREIQAQEGVSSPNMWGPPASGGSTPLRETIPESPSQDGFPDFVPPADDQSSTLPNRRARAGTVPSRFSPGNPAPGLTSPSYFPKTSRPTPSTSPFKPNGVDSGSEPRLTPTPPSTSASTSTSTLLSRLRAGSMPYGVKYLGSTGPFGSNISPNSWTSTRERSSTLASIRSSNTPSSPAQSQMSQMSREGFADADVKTLDYLGLAETPQQNQSQLAVGNMTGLANGSLPPMLQPFYTDLTSFNKNMSRYRSYSVNATEKYADEEDVYNPSSPYSGLHSGALTPSAASTAAALAATQAQIHQHNLAVQAFANQASASRPRAKTASMLDSPMRLGTQNFLPIPSRLDNSITAADLDFLNQSGSSYDAITQNLRALQLSGMVTANGYDGEDTTMEGPTRALWLGSIPTSTTVSSLEAIFSRYGRIESVRVLVHKNCGFINFDDTESAMRAKLALNGKEIFPGAGPVRIGYAKALSSSGGGSPSKNGAFPSPSPDPFMRESETERIMGSEEPSSVAQASSVHEQGAAAALHVPELKNLKTDMMQIVRDFGANENEIPVISSMIDSAVAFDCFEDEIPAVPEPSHARTHDAPKLREIRKRIDNNAISPSEIEEIALGMLPEIAELSSDYLGNTVVQKLFEYCSESVKEAMLAQIAPHLAEVGVHKNGTWAAQKIIEVAKTPEQIQLIADSLRPYTVGLFLDQYGNYVLQCCLRFGFPYNNFIFESMLGRLWEISQGRFGARAMRACLESHHATKDQQRMLASAIALHSVQLATNANGALLLTWFLDTCMFPQRRTVLAPRLVPHLVHLCTHKVAYLTVLKVINQKTEVQARETVLQALFFSDDDKTLEDILSDQAYGATLIFKVLTTPFFDEDIRSEVVQKIRSILSRLKAPPASGYKRLMDEIGLSSRSNSKADRGDYSMSNGNNSPYHDRGRPMSQQGLRNGSMERQHSGNHYSPMHHQQQPPYIATSSMSMDGNPAGMIGGSGFDSFNVNSPVFTPSAIVTPNMQYQHALINNQARSVSNAYYPNMNGMSAYSPAQQSNYQGFQGQNQGMMQPAAFGGAAPPGLGGMVGSGMMGGYVAQPYNMYYPQQMQQQQQQQTGGRRGRR
ncbi:hypothetical protein MMC25_001032 [Agyrium rufum]|nr:hypothetical protein [Agyrium rufum]